MAFILDVTVFPDEAVDNNAKLIQAFATQLIPNADFSKGTALYDLLIRPAAVLQTVAEVNVNRARTAGSLLRISQFPELADTEMVDELLSNYRMQRRAGTTAAGTVEILISSNTVTAIPSGSVFVSGGLRFFTNQSFVGVPSQSLVSSTTDRLITSQGNGVFSFLVDVVAETNGTAYQLSQGVTLVLQTPSSNYITSRAAYDFTTGVGQETTAEMILRMPASLANRTPGNRTNILALIQEQYPAIRNVSTIGYGEAEMTRDQDNLFLFSYGGKSDIYTQTVLRPQVIRVTKSAVLMSKTAQTWHMFFDRDEFAGVYKINAVLRTDRSDALGTLRIVTEARGLDLSRPSGSPDAFVPHVDNFTQAAFSRFQTLALDFVDPYEDTTNLTELTSTRDYYVDMLVMPDIATIQDTIFSSATIRAHRYDDIVRAPIPCLVSISMGVRLRQGDTINTTGVQQAIADRINQLGFRSSLSASYAVEVAQQLIAPQAAVVMPIDMLGEFIDPATGASVTYRSATALTIPTDTPNSVSAKTTMFFCDPSDINIYIERS